MIEAIIDRPGAFFVLVVVIAVLSLCAILRSRRDLNLRRRTSAPRRRIPRPDTDRRWEAQRRRG